MKDKAIYIRVNSDLKANFDSLCNKYYLNKSEVLRDLIRNFVTYYEQSINNTDIPLEIKDSIKKALGF